MIRARFKVPTEDGDYRPVVWPIKHPYWCTGYDSDNVPILVAYADDEAEILRLWPEAEEIDAEEATTYSFSSRFQCPDWFQEQQPKEASNG